MVAAAGRDSQASAEALSRLCAAYWFPVYAFIRRKGFAREEAEDLTQEFFARLLEYRTLGAADRKRGKFRSFLLASVTNFLANELDRARAQKRGGGYATVSLDFAAGEERYRLDPSHNITPEALFLRQWSLALLDLVLARLREEYGRKSHAEQFDRLQPFLTGDQERGSYEELAGKLGMSAAALRTAVHLLRRRYADLIREEIAAIVEDPEEVDGEIRFLLAALDGR